MSFIDFFHSEEVQHLLHDRETMDCVSAYWIMHREKFRHKGEGKAVLVCGEDHFMLDNENEEHLRIMQVIEMLADLETRRPPGFRENRFKTLIGAMEAYLSS